VTFDSVTSCVAGLPNAAGYAAQLDTRNALTGDFVITSRAERRAVGDALVGLHGRNSHPSLTGSAPRFYGRFHNHADVMRKPLPSKWVVPYDQANGGSTSVLVWREPNANAASFECGQAPTGQPGAFKELLAFDEQEEVTAITGAHFRTAASRVEVGTGGLAVPSQKGFLVFDLDDASGSGGPPSLPTFRQGFVLGLRTDATGGTSWVRRAFPVPVPPVRTGVLVDDERGVVVAGSRAASFTVRLSASPAANVAIPLSGPPNIVLSPNPVVLTAANATQGVTVTVSQPTPGFSALREFIVGLGTTSSTDAAWNNLDPVDAVVRIQN
jgi:hypothetical protein